MPYILSVQVKSGITYQIGNPYVDHLVSYLSQNPENTCFVFVIDGAFEVQNRLVYSKDGILLPEAGEVEFDALSNGGILLRFEL